MLRRFAPVPLALAASLSGQAPVVKTTAEFYPADVEQTHGDERWLTVRVVDGVSGQPIAGAELLLIAESPHPLRGGQAAVCAGGGKAGGMPGRGEVRWGR